MNENEELLVRYRHTRNEEEQARLYSELMNLLNERKQLEKIKRIESKLGIDVETYFKVKGQGYIYYKTLDGKIRKSKVWGQFFGYDWCWYLRNPKKKDRKRVRMKHYGKTWAFTKEELN